jgi:septal ring factor EnvC (AmiA/AmiB activator)
MKLNKLKGLFVVTEENEDQKNTEANKQTEQKQTVENKTTQETSKTKVNWKIESSSTTTPSSTETKGAFNQQIFDQLTKAIANANLPGEDYLEFMEALKAMKDIPLDENVKIQTVLATLSTKGLTIKTVLESADYYLKILDNEKTKFNEAVNSQTQGQINKKQKDIENLEKQIKSKTEQIALLTQEITKSQEEILKVKNEMAMADDKIKATQNSFATTYEMVANQIIDNVTKIKALGLK